MKEFGILSTLLILFFMCIHGKESISVVSFSNSAIESYSNYVFAVNEMFCKRHQLQWIPLSPQTQIPFISWISPPGSEKDPRWEKVNVLLSLIGSSLTCNDKSCSTSLLQFQYLIWMDADMMIVNFEDNFLQRWIDLYPTHDILISAEYHAETGIANTGCIIMKRSNWTYQFLQQWWVQDHSRGHDQILFDVLYQKLVSKTSSTDTIISDHIQILPFRALNSLPPAYLTFSDQDSVLHLMGERHDYRKRVFGFAYENIARTISQNPSTSFRVSQVGIDISFLRASLLIIIENRIPVLLDLMSHVSEEFSLQTIYWKSIIENLDTLVSEYRELLLQYGQLSDGIVSSTTPNNRRLLWLESGIQSWDVVYKICLEQWFLPAVSSASYNEPLVSLQALSSSQITIWIDILNTLSMLENDFITEYCHIYPVSSMSIGQWDFIQKKYINTRQKLLWLVSWVAPGTSERLVWSMLATLLQNQALSLHQRAVLFQSQENDIALWKECFNTLQFIHIIYKEKLLKDASDTSSKFAEEFKSFRYRWVSVFHQEADAHCAYISSALTSGNNAETVFNDKKRSFIGAMDAYHQAAQIWELLLHLPVPTNNHPHSTLDNLVWQEDNDHYLTVIQQALRCITFSYDSNFVSMMQDIFDEYYQLFDRKYQHLSQLFPSVVKYHAYSFHLTLNAKQFEATNLNENIAQSQKAKKRFRKKKKKDE